MGVAVSQQNDLLAVSAGNNVYLYEMKPLVDEQEIQKYPAGSFSYSIKFNPEGTLLAAGSRDGFVRVWNVAGGDRLPVFSINAHRNGVNSIAFSHDGRMLASGGNDAVIRIWDIETEQLLIEMIGGTYAVPAIEFSPDNQHVAIANGEVIRIRDVSTGQIWGTIRSPGWLYNLAYNLDHCWQRAISNNKFTSGIPGRRIVQVLKHILNHKHLLCKIVMLLVLELWSGILFSNLMSRWLLPLMEMGISVPGRLKPGRLLRSGIIIPLGLQVWISVRMESPRCQVVWMPGLVCSQLLIDCDIS